MSKLQDLIEKRGKIADKIQDMNKCLDDFTPENEISFNNLSDEYDNLDKRVQAAEKIESVENDMNSFENTKKPIIASPEEVSKYGNTAYERAFQNYIQSKGQIRNDLEVGTDAKGGYVVSESWERTLDKYLENEVVMRQVATVRKFDDTRNIPLSTDNGTAAYMAEGGSYSTNDVTMSTVVFGANTIGNIVKLSEELLADSFVNLTAEVGEMYGMTFGVTEETGFTSGSGSAPNPTGFLTSATNAVTAASATAITFDELIDLMSAVRAVYARNGLFMMNRATAAKVRKLKDSNGQYLWQPSTSLGAPETLLGHRLVINEAMPASTTGLKAVAFGDFKQFVIADRERLQMQILTEKYADTGEIGFKFHKRNDSKLKRAEAIQTLTMA